MKYCTRNAHPNPDEAGFCRSCGDSNFTPTPPSQPPPPPDKKRKGHKTASLGALAVVLFFLLPWISVSCSSLPQYSVTFSGWELAAGKTVGTQTAPGSPVLFVFLLAGFLALAIVFPAWLRGYPEPRERYELIALALVALFLGWLQFKQVTDAVGGTTLGTYRADLLIGFWGTLGGYLAIIAGALGLIDK